MSTVRKISIMARTPTTNFTLDDQLCFALYTASRAMTAAYREGLSPLGITYTQYVVLLILWEEEPLTVGELCERLHLDTATLSPLLKRLETRGLVTRRRRSSDERVVEVTCTPEGQSLYDAVKEVQADVELATGLGGPEIASLREQLHHVAVRLRENTGATGDANPL